MTRRECTKKFKEAGLTKEQISYAHTLMRMYLVPIERIIEMAKEYISLSDAIKE